jgi:hypothetical protein
MCIYLDRIKHFNYILQIIQNTDFYIYEIYIY